jgi:hypothetical protein
MLTFGMLGGSKLCQLDNNLFISNHGNLLFRNVKGAFLYTGYEFNNSLPQIIGKYEIMAIKGMLTNQQKKGSFYA